VSVKLNKTTLGNALAASDVAYFEAAAENTHCLGGVLSQIPGFPGLSLASVLHSLTGIGGINTWLEQVETCFSNRGSNWVRFYLQQVSDRQREQLQKWGYCELVEIGFATRLGVTGDEGTVLQRCVNEQQWREYTRLSLISVDGPDGFDMDGDSYARVSRLKVEAGYMVPYLAILHGKLVGFVNLSLQGDFARCKNLLVHPDYRGQGIGSSIISAAMATARDQGARYFGAYAIAGEPSVALYCGLGMVEVTRQSEWSRPLGNA